MLWALVTIVLVLAICDELMRQTLKFRAWRANQHLPAFFMSRPFGIPNFINMIKASLANEALEHTLAKYHKVCRKTFIQQFSFDMEYHTADPENIKALLSTQFKDFDLGMREQTLGFFIGSGIFTVSGEKWKHSRALLRPQFSRQLVAQLDSVDAHVSVLVDKLKAGTHVDFQALFHSLTMDTATEFLFGESTNTLQESKAARNGIAATEFVEDYRLCVGHSLVRFSLGPLHGLYKPKAFCDAIARCRRYIDYFVDQALQEAAAGEKAKSYTFSHELAKVTKNPVEIRDQLLNILIAGHDTTGNFLGYFVWYMGHYPEVWRKLRESIAVDLDGCDITFESIKRLTYLSHVINEVLRLHPIVPRNLRFATRDTTLPRGAGPDESLPIFVPRGSAVSYNSYILQRDPDFWGIDANEFKPERWAKLSTVPWTFIPFNGGPRICLGQQFALTEASLTIIRMAQHFSSFDLDEPALRHPKTKAELTGQVAGGVWGTACRA